MGHATNVFEFEQIIHGAAHTPIHIYLQRIIPWLESRQVTAKRLDNPITEEGRKHVLEMLRQHDTQIQNLLHMLPNNQTNDNRSENSAG